MACTTIDYIIKFLKNNFGKEGLLTSVLFSILLVSLAMSSNEALAQTAPAPTAPQNLHAVTVSSSQINLDWADPANSAGSYIMGYKIERSIDNGNTWKTIISNTNYTEDGYLDQSLSASTAYTYRVSTINSAGTSQPSNTASATTNSGSVPSAPTQTGTIFHDDYLSSSGWTQLGSQITVDSTQFPNMVKYNNEAGGGGVDQERTYKQLVSTLPAYDWVLETTYEFTSSSMVSAYPVALTINSGNPETTPYLEWAQSIVIQHGLGSDQLRIGFVNTASSGIPISPNVSYYLRLERTQSQLVLFVFSDPSRTMQVAGSPVTLAADPTALQNLDFIQHSGSISSGPARTLTAQVTNTTIYIRQLPTGTIAGVPSQPSGLTASETSQSQISLHWMAPYNGGSPITNYKIYRSASPGTEALFTTIGNATLYNDTGLTEGNYYYKVAAINSVGQSQQSNEAGLFLATSPSSPQNLTAITISPSQINLQWADPSNNGGSYVIGYKVERSASNANTWTTIVPDTNYTEDGYLDQNLSASTAYAYRVSAINSAGAGQPSNIASATTNSNTVPPPPTKLGVFFHDNYTSSAGWTQLGTEVTVGSAQFPNMVKYYNEAGGGGIDQERVYKQLPSALPAYGWVLETSYEFASSNMVSAYPIALTINSGNAETTPYLTWAQSIVIQHGLGTDQLRIGFVNTASSGIPIYPNVSYYLRLERTQSQLVLYAFSDPARTIQIPGSPVTLAANPTSLQNLDFIQHSGSISSGPARTLTAQVTNTTIYIRQLPTGTIAGVPSPPSGLNASAASQSRISLHWIAPSSNGGSPITGYEVERARGGLSYGAFSNSTNVFFFSYGNSTSFADTGLSSDTAYNYTVFAKNFAGSSSPSNNASNMTQPSILPSTSVIQLKNVYSGLMASDSLTNETMTQQQMLSSTGYWTYGGDASYEKAPYALSRDMQGLHVGVRSPANGTWAGYYAAGPNTSATLFHSIVTVPISIIPYQWYQPGMTVETSGPYSNYVSCFASTGAWGTTWALASVTNTPTTGWHYNLLWSDPTYNQPLTRDCTIITNGTNYLKMYLDNTLVYQNNALNLQIQPPFNTYLGLSTSYPGQLLNSTYHGYYVTAGEDVTVTKLPSNAAKVMIQASNAATYASSPVTNGMATLGLGSYDFPLSAKINVYDSSNNIIASTQNLVNIYGGDIYSGS